MRSDKKLNKLLLGIFLFIIWGSLVGCGSKERISLEAVSDEAQEERGEKDTEETEKTEISEKEVSGTEEKEAEEGKEAGTEASETFSVYVCGAVNLPGVYEFPAGSRLYQAIQAAGGMREDADENYLNLAMQLTDGEKIRVPTKEEVQSGLVETVAEGSAFESSLFDGRETASATAGLVNINTADEALLMTLTGIGEAKARSIIAYREEQGAFSKIEDIMNISGIKQTVFEKIKDKICVN